MINFLASVVIILLPTLLLMIEFWDQQTLLFISIIIGVLHLVLAMNLPGSKYRAEIYFVSILGLLVIGVLNDSSLPILLAALGFAIVGNGVLYKSTENQKPVSLRLNGLEIVVVPGGIILSMIGSSIQGVLNFWFVAALTIISTILLVTAISKSTD